MGRAAEFLFITDCLQEEEVLRHIKVNLGITSASDIEELPFFGKNDEKEKHVTFKIYVSNQKEVQILIKNSLAKTFKIKIIVVAYAINSTVYQRNDLNPYKLKLLGLPRDMEYDFYQFYKLASHLGSV